MTSIKFCGCNTGAASKYQDETYGKGMRVCNHKRKGSPTDVLRVVCTCCNKII